MSVLRCLFILPLGLLVAVSGCSGSRMRQIFTPDREFMALSELEEYDQQSVAERYSSRRTNGLLASLSRDKADKTEDSETPDDDNARLLSFSRWLPSRKGEDLPTDPFVGLDADDTQATEEEVAIAEADTEPSAAEPMVTAGLSRELPTDPVDDFDFDISEFEKSETDSTSTAMAEDRSADEDQDDVPTFADIMSELEIDKEPEDIGDHTDDLDQLAEAWLAAQEEPETETAPADTAAEPGLTDFEALLAEATEAISPAASSDDEIPGLDFNSPLGDPENERAEQLVAELDFNEALEDGDRLIEDPDDTSSFTVDELVELDAMPELPVPLPEVSQVTQSDSQVETSLDNDIAAPPFEDLMDHQDPAPADDPIHIAVEQPSAQPFDDDFESIRNDFRPPAFRHPATSLQQQRPAAEPAAITRGADVFDDTRFLNDFESQVTAATAAPVATQPPAAGGTSIISRHSARTWLLLLGAVIIGYLLLAPERQSLRHSHNR